MKKPRFLPLPIATLVLAMSPLSAIADSGALDELTQQLQSTGSVADPSFVNEISTTADAPLSTGTALPTSSFVEGALTVTTEDLADAQSSQWQSIPPPNPIDTTSERIDSTFDPDRLIDPVTGRIDDTIDGITGRVDSAINQTLNSLLSPIDEAVDGAFDAVDSIIDDAIESIMAPVDDVINSVMASIDSTIESLLGGVIGEVGDVVGGVVDDVTGGLFGDVFGSGEQRIAVEPTYNPTSPLSSIITATSFQAELAGMSAPYVEPIPFAMGSMGLPDYSKIMPTLDALAQGESGNPNSVLQGLDRFSTSPETLKMSLSGEVERIASRSIAQSTLSEAGQEDMKAQLDGATKTLENIVAIGDASQDLDVTQDVMKSLTAQLANDSVIRTGQYKQSLLMRQQAAADAVVNADIARLLGEQNRASRADIISNAAKMHTIAGQLHLPGEMPDE